MNGWIKAGDRPGEYAHGIEEGERRAGKRVAYLRCTAAQPSGFGTVMQMIDADEYRGKRVRFYADVRPSEVGGKAGLWMRVDGPLHGQPLAFDNMNGRPITGTAGWQRYEVVLDVAQQARAIGFGILLGGGGAVQFADLRFECVGADVPTTDPPRPPLPKQPQNLDLSVD